MGSRSAGGWVAADCYLCWTAPPAAVAPSLIDPAPTRQPRVRQPGLGGPFSSSDKFICMCFSSNRLTAAQPPTPSANLAPEVRYVRLDALSTLVCFIFVCGARSGRGGRSKLGSGPG